MKTNRPHPEGEYSDQSGYCFAQSQNITKKILRMQSEWEDESIFSMRNVRSNFSKLDVSFEFLTNNTKS